MLLLVVLSRLSETLLENGQQLEIRGSSGNGDATRPKMDL